MEWIPGFMCPRLLAHKILRTIAKHVFGHPRVEGKKNLPGQDYYYNKENVYQSSKQQDSIIFWHLKVCT